MEFRETRDLIRRLKSRSQGYQQFFAENNYGSLCPVVNLASKKENNETYYKVYASMVKDNGETAHCSLDGSSSYHFSTTKVVNQNWFGFDKKPVWNYNEPTSWLGRSRTTQTFKDRDSAEEIVYHDAKRFASIIARGLEAQVVEISE